MSEVDGKPLPGKATREDRLAAKLRENLKRRKQQSRAMEQRDDTLPKAPDDR